MNVRRLGFFVAALPLAFYAYACSSDDAGSGEETPDGGGIDGSSDFDTGTNPGVDSGNPDTDSGTDAGGDGAVSACVGNPLIGEAAATPDGGVAVEAGVLRTLTGPTNQFNDGPQWIDQFGGALVYTELNQDRIVRIGPDGGAPVVIRTVPNGGVNNGLKPVGNAIRNGVILTVVTTTSNNPGQIWQTLPDGGSGGPNLGLGGSTNPNDIAVAASGQAYFSDGQYQNNPAVNPGVFRLLGDGGVTTIQQDNGRANGIALSPDGAKLYVGVGPLPNETPATNRKILAYNIDNAGGSPIIAGNPATVVAAASLGGTPDGLAVDVGGNIWAAVADSAGGNNGAIEVFSPAGAKLGSIAVAGDRPVGIAFGGADSKTVYLTTENGVRVYQSRCAGLR